MLILYFLTIPCALTILIGAYSLYDNRKSLRSNVPLYIFSLCSLIWTGGVWVCYMRFSPAASKLGLFFAEAATTGAMPVLTSAMYQKSAGSKFGKYGLRGQILLYLFFMIFHFKGYYVNAEIIDGNLLITHGDSLLYHLYVVFNVLSPFLCMAILIESAIRMGFKREWFITLILTPLYLLGSYLLYRRFPEPGSRIFGCFVQTMALVLLFLFTKQYNIRAISDTQAAHVVFSTVRTSYLFVGIQGDIFYANTSALRFFGLSMESIRGKKPADLFRFNGEGPEVFKRYREEGSEREEYRAVALHNNARCHLTVMYQYDAFGELVCVILQVEDVTEREQLFTQLEAERQRAEDAAAAKSNFLAKTSHEIRTPMNAIMGMAELLLRKNIPADAYEDALNIKQAGSNLLSIINDILDFSKIESGRIDVVSAEYLFASMMNDVINIIRMRIAEKPIMFLVDIDGNLPAGLEGDEVRIRQVLLNLLSNGIKYTREGQITFTISGERRGEDLILLTIEVADTGIGIKEEDMEKLFDEFVQLDSHGNQGIEGTGLGLAISRNLCRLMGGDIQVQSRYGEGSTFTATLPQKVKDPAPFAQVENPETKTVLFYESREPYALSVIRSLENLSVPVRRVSRPEELYRELERGPASDKWYPFVFVSTGIAEKTLALIRILGLRTLPVLLSEAGEIASFQNIPFISMPAYVLPIANLLNDKQTTTYREKASVNFIAPEAKILIVDDIMTNLNVARGLLALYQMDIQVSTGGAEAIELIKKNCYDIVFMDHMMPEMDGIEATRIIRAMGAAFRELPIIALTANVVSGMREMFLEKGFNDYLAKPIEIAKLNEIIGKWIPKHKQQRSFGENSARPSPLRTASPSLHIEGLDTGRGISLTGGTEEGYRKVLASFCLDARNRIDILRTVPDEQSLPLFTTQVHALKSAAAYIGAVSLSKETEDLEAAGKAGDFAAIRKGLPEFYEHLKELAERIDRALGEPKRADQSPDGATAPGDALAASGCLPLFAELREALENESLKTVDRLLAEFEAMALDKKTRKTVETISNQVLVAEFKAALDTVNELLGENEH
jgi:PAS domain S-box-containing protein